MEPDAAPYPPDQLPGITVSIIDIFRTLCRCAYLCRRRMKKQLKCSDNRQRTSILTRTRLTFQHAISAWYIHSMKLKRLFIQGSSDRIRRHALANVPDMKFRLPVLKTNLSSRTYVFKCLTYVFPHFAPLNCKFGRNRTPLDRAAGFSLCHSGIMSAIMCGNHWGKSLLKILLLLSSSPPEKS